jgi:hypothetical protein
MRGMPPRLVIVALTVALTAMLLVPVGDARAEYPIFDAHIHYSQPDWDAYTPERALSILARAGVRRAIVSSTPDDGTLKLYDRAPAGIVPFLRPYRNRGDMSTWARDLTVIPYVEERLKRGVYKGIGEFHLSLDDADGPVVKRFAELAAARDIFLYAHVDDATIVRMATLYPSVKLLWAHAGMSAPAETVGKVVAQYPKVSVELSLRSDVASGGTLDPAWGELFVRHPDRFLIGTDTWTTSRWEIVRDWMRGVQGWLAQLPKDVAEQIAWKNGERLFPPP